MPEKKKSVVPRLRFPEFRDAGEWEVKRLGEVCSTFSGGTPDSSRKEYYGGSIPFIRSAEINQDKTELFLTEEGFKNSSAKLAVKGGILIALYGANSGDGALSKIDGAINQAILCLRSKFNHIFILDYWRLRKNEIVMQYIQGGQGNLSAEIVKSIAFAFPSPSEQQKIADCLSSLDEVIDLEAQKLEALKAHKKGLMQQLFPREGETTPRLRFPEFRDAGEWERYRFRELLTLEYGASLPEESRLGGVIPVVGSNGVVGFHNQALISGPVIIVGRKGSVGKINWIESDCYPIDTTFYVKLESQDTLLAFIKLLLENTNLTFLSDNGAVPGLNRNDVYVLKTALPCEAEQQKIAECLSSLDEVINLQTQKLDALKAHKKGLMQQLFPQEVD